MSTLGWFVFRSQRDACDRLIEFLSTRPERPRRIPGATPPDDPLAQPVDPYRAAHLLAKLALPVHAAPLRNFAEDPSQKPWVCLDAYAALARVSDVPPSTRRTLLSRLVADFTARNRSPHQPWDPEAARLAGALACDGSPAALRDAETTLDRLEPAARVATLVALPWRTHEPGAAITAHLLERFAERFWLCDRPALEADSARLPSESRGAHPLVEEFALATAARDARARALLFDAWSRETDGDARSLIEDVEVLPGFVDYLAARPALLDRAARAFRLPARVLIEHFGPATLVRRIESAVRAGWSAARDEHGWAPLERAERGIALLAELPGGERVAYGLLAEYCQRPCADPGGEPVDSLVHRLVAALWSRDPTQTIALARSAAERAVRGAVVRSAVLDRIADEPTPAYRDELLRALTKPRNPGETLAAIRGLEALGECEPGWVAALRSLNAGDDRILTVERAAALMRAGDADAERELAAAARDVANRAVAERAIWALVPRVAAHRALFEWVLLARPLAYCPCCDRDAADAADALGTLGDDDARTTVFRGALRVGEDGILAAAARVLAQP